MPEESIDPFPARVKRRSVDTDGVCVSCVKLALPPVYRRVPPLKTRLAEPLEDAPMLLTVLPLARLVTPSTAPPLRIVGPV